MYFKICLSLIFVSVFVDAREAKIIRDDAIVRQKRSDDSDPLEAVVEHLSQQVNALNTKVAALEAKTGNLDKTVAFYVWHSTNPLHTTAHGTLILDHASTNIGNGYDTLTGVFTAPSSGLYYFQTTFLCYDHGTNAHAAIYVDNNLMAVGISDNSQSLWDQTTLNTIVHVHAGQRVYVKNIDGRANQYYDTLTSPHTTFSGFLISAD